ncbi:MAG TPA: DUF1926 domain-containing protein, partial [Spirochaetia bacterium]|nr:DUF1926 domain-containing protein [Spirochaetia bacterium]
VWESSLPNTLKSCGIEYTFLNEHAFLAAHSTHNELFYPRATEAFGKNITVFPLATRLQERLFALSPERLVKAIRRLASAEGDRVITLIIDGNCYTRQFVLSPKRKYKNWLKEFFGELQKHQKTIIPITPSDYLKTRPVRRKMFFPGSYSRSVYLATLPTARQPFPGSLVRRITTDGRVESNFKQVFTKYQDASLMYAKMMYTHLTVHQIRGDKSRKKSALQELWKGQCHYAYWHGAHLGIYNNPLRKEIYKSFISAEKYSRIKGSFLSSIITTDFDFDGENEFLYQSNEMNVYIHRRGGMVFELDYIPAFWNYLDTVTRISERYHRNGETASDPYPRKAFLEHFFSLDHRRPERPFPERMVEHNDCRNELYSLAELKRDQRQIALQTQVPIGLNGAVHAVEVRKQYYFKKNTVIVSYALRNPEREPVAFLFGSEINLSFISSGKEIVRVFDTSKKTAVELKAAHHERKSVRKLTLEDKHNNVSIELSSQSKYRLFNQALTSRALENGKLGEQFQSLMLLPYWEVELKPEEIWETTLELSLQKS